MKSIISLVVALLLVSSVSFAEENTKPMGGGGEVPFPLFKQGEQVELKGLVLKKIITICTSKPAYKFRVEGHKEVVVAANNDEARKSLHALNGKRMPAKIYGKYVEEKEKQCKYVLVDKVEAGPGKKRSSIASS